MKTSIYDIYKLSLEVTGSNARKFQKSMLLYIVAFTFQGLAFCMFFPLLNAMFGEHDWSIINKSLVAMAIFSLVFFITKYRAQDFDYTGNIVEVSDELRKKLATKLKNIPLKTLCNTGELSYIFSSGVEESILHLGVIFSLFLQALVVPLVLVVFLCFYSWKMAALICIFIPFGAYLFSYRRRVGFLEKELNRLANEQLESAFLEYIQGIGVLRAENLAGNNAKDLQEKIKAVRIVQIQNMKAASIPSLLMDILVSLCMLTCMFFGVYLIGDFSLASLAALLVVLTRINEPLGVLLGILSVFDAMDSAFRKIKEILNLEVFATTNLGAKPKNHDIEIKNLSFAYESELVLKNINLSIKENSLTALVGASGSGKSTLIRLLMRYADAQTGSIKIGGVDIKNMTNEELMANFSVVFQDVYLFNDTILNNIKIANSDDEAAKIAAKKANCDEFIESLPHKFDEIVGDIGAKLSGGEKQRISIARAILKDAPIVILDEPTSSLDIKSEIEVQKAVDELLKNKSVIVISHRLRTIANADNIVVLDNGQIIGQGRHEELIRQKGKYFSMWQATQKRLAISS